MVGNGTGGVLTPTNLHWDDANTRLGIGTPRQALSVTGNVTATGTVTVGDVLIPGYSNVSTTLDTLTSLDYQHS
jgi:hypothetical protein